MRKLLVSAAAFSVVAFAAGSASATRSPAFSATLSGPLDPVTLAPVSPAYGDSVVFDAEGVTADQYPWLIVACTQGRTQVYYAGANQPGISLVFTLADQGSTLWSWPANTAASCTAELSVLNGKNHKVVAQVSFTVSS